ncbi:hypothetical protein B2G71_10520 [Novosphingobium sp. PC22D]|uniref:DUF4169 family protein n=1 Tax=Novosphingobium sp. PC22D TaxID=1962403 RepID=UPI000BEF3774|nr:DUF4169 family protein [Novosphingobium sp. PC22D]PEQ12727.1 hypothetical protein B2G71_10520 [Novosphingobium sp. PC22D]
MGEIVNLRAARKIRLRRDKEAQAEAQRIRHGRTKAERRLAEAEAARSDRQLEGARRDPRDDPGDGDA